MAIILITIQWEMIPTLITILTIMITILLILPVVIKITKLLHEETIQKLKNEFDDNKIKLNENENIRNNEGMDKLKKESYS